MIYDGWMDGMLERYLTERLSGFHLAGERTCYVHTWLWIKNDTRFSLPLSLHGLASRSNAFLSCLVYPDVRPYAARLFLTALHLAKSPRAYTSKLTIPRC